MGFSQINNGKKSDYFLDTDMDKNKYRVLMNTANKLWIPLHVEKFLISCRTASFLRRILLHGSYIQHMDSNNNSMESK